METRNARSARGRIPSFDLICVFSCLCVTIVHFNAAVCGYDGTFIHLQNSIIPNFYLGGRVYLGGIGVSLFFMLSGARQMYSYQGIRQFYQKRVLRLYPMYWMAYLAASIFDFLFYKGMNSGNPLLGVFSLLGMDGYLCSLGLIPYDFYKLGEWFLGCILCLYILFPLLHWGVKKHPAATAVISLGIYVLCVDRVNSQLFWMRIPELLWGMYFVEYHWEEHPLGLMVFSGMVFAAAYVFRDMISSLSLSIALCLLIFSIWVVCSKRIRNDALKSILAHVANMTYPVFLVHHWLIDKLVMGFDLERMPRRYVIMMFLIYLIFTLVLAQALMRCSKRAEKTVRGISF